MLRKSSSPLGGPAFSFESLSLSQYFDFFGDEEDNFLNFEDNLKDASDMLLPLENKALLAFNFLSNSL